MNVKTTCDIVGRTDMVVYEGLTTQLQSLDVCINRTFKASICLCYYSWLTSRKNLQNLRIIKHPVSVLAQRILDA